MINRTFYSLIQWTWGLPQTLAGAGLHLMHRKDRHYRYHGAVVTEWKRNDGVSLGKFVFIPERKKPADDYLLKHEYGHTLQSLVLGPAYLVVIGLPSFLWNRTPYFVRMRKETGKSYYSLVFENTANRLGAHASDRFAKRDAK